jgi:hypothetical protein
VISTENGGILFNNRTVVYPLSDDCVRRSEESFDEIARKNNSLPQNQLNRNSRSQRLRVNPHLLEEVRSLGISFKLKPAIFDFIHYLGLVIDFMHCSKNVVTSLFQLFRGERFFTLHSVFEKENLTDILQSAKERVTESNELAECYQISQDHMAAMSEAWKGILIPSDSNFFYYNFKFFRMYSACYFLSSFLDWEPIYRYAEVCSWFWSGGSHAFWTPGSPC